LSCHLSLACDALQVKWGELEPVWEETFTLYVPRKEKQILRLRMIDKNKLLSDVDMGTVMVAISDLIEKPGQKLALQLQGVQVMNATAPCYVSCFSFTDFCSVFGMILVIDTAC
jgi:hypothetical protein